VPSRSPAPGGASASAPAPATQPAPAAGDRRATLLTAGVVGALVLLVGGLRYLGPACCLTPARPPDVVSVLAGLALIGAGAVALARFPAGRWLWHAAVILLVIVFVVLKTEPLARALSAALRGMAGQAPDLAAAADVRWLGFSYVAFRLIHVLRDRALGRLPAVSLREFITYVIFFPAYTAGPIDRVERFVKDARTDFRLTAADALSGGSRIAVGVLRKFVIADSLALVALSPANADQVAGSGWMWLLLYAYAIRLYFDFSGYTDIALGLGRLFGIRLPENFDRPYLRQNLTLFWNSWHNTLAQWFRTYVFNPLTRALRARPLPPAAIIFLTQMVVMVLIGLWHGVTWNFVIWGAWHGLGLFIHNRWADRMKPRATALDKRPRLKLAAHVAGVLLTFHFVALGWVWFALPSTGQALHVLARLFGL
jgi:D-alanyl-lipoteichoic acid acyltransferase DltB (MBOAT superfamily)